MENLEMNVYQPQDRGLVPAETQDMQSSFILANTVSSTLTALNHEHIIPVYVKDNERLISHGEFVEATQEVVQDMFHGEYIMHPKIRVSHPIKGRIPEAKDKPASQLLDREKTLYYERMAFVIEVPSIQDQVDGNPLSLTIGGVKAYNQDNLYNRKGADEHFKIFIGFQNRVCTNLCVWTDGCQLELRVKSLSQLKGAIKLLVENFNASYQLDAMRMLTQFQLSEQQFAGLIGRCRMYQHLPHELKHQIPPILFGDTQLGAVVKDFYRDHSFCRDASGNINLWRMYNLFTGVNKSTYVDSFLERSVNAFQFVDQMRVGLEHPGTNWFLN